MTPAARLSAAIEVLDRILAGEATEQCLTNWGRANRYAGSGDRAAIRDLVYDAQRNRRSYAALGGALTGRGLILGGLRAEGVDPAPLFTGEGYAPAPVSADEAPKPLSKGDALNLPDWLLPYADASMGDRASAVFSALSQRAPVFLRVNLARCQPEQAMRALARDHILARPHALAASALEVTEGQRKIATSSAYRDGLVELQDASSQAVVEMLPLGDGMRVLDFCAGGGGKTLAMGARARLKLFAHDANPHRMADLKVRAARACLAVELTDRPEMQAPFDLVLTDVPCSGSGSWRRDPDGKWSLTPAAFAQLTHVQEDILVRAAGLVRPGGTLAYATCSLFRDENGAQIERFLARHENWKIVAERQFTPLETGDGFYAALLTRVS